MFNNIFRQQARLALSARSAFQLSSRHRQSLPTLSTTPKSILSQRTLFISRPLLNDLAPEAVPLPASPVELIPGQKRTPEQRELTPPQCAIYVGNLPFSADEVDVKELFEQYGKIRRITLATDADNRSKGYAFVEFFQLEDSMRVVKSGYAEPFFLLNRRLNIHFAEQRSFDPPTGKPNRTLHISNYPLPGDDAPLRELLEEYQDKIERINFMKDAGGNPTRKTFIQFTDVETSKAVLETFQKATLKGVDLNLFYAKERSQRRAQRTLNSQNQSQDSNVFDA